MMATPAIAMGRPAARPGVESAKADPMRGRLGPVPRHEAAGPPASLRHPERRSRPPAADHPVPQLTVITTRPEGFSAQTPS